MGLITNSLGIGGPPDQAKANIEHVHGTAGAMQAYNQTQDAMAQQQNLLNALQGQNGLNNQSQMYNQLGNTAGQYQNIANGTGPNPALAQLNQTTGQNIANQAAMMAGQRGAGQNVGLMARQASQQGANTQQQAAGQAATLAANQQIAGLQGLAGVQGQQAAIANTQAGQQIGQVNTNQAAQMAQQQAILNQITAQNNAEVGSQTSMNAGNASMQNQYTKTGGDLTGGALQGAGSAMAMMADGGVISGQPQGPQSSVAKFLSNVVAPQQSYGSTDDSELKRGSALFTQALLSPRPTMGNSAGEGQDMSAVANKGGLVKVVVSPGEKLYSPQAVQKVAQGGTAKGKTVPGKAEVKGDSIKNDKVAAKLPAGSVVVKRTRANNDPEGFIRSVLAKRKASK